jgi:hypothetical protein
MTSVARIAMILALGALSAPADAQTLLGATQNWSAYQATTPDGKVCYVLSKPTAVLPVKASRDPIYFVVSIWPGRNAQGELEVFPGYTYKAGEPVFAQIGTVRAEFFTRNDGKVGTAWVKDAADEGALVAAMRGGSKLTVTGVSKRGTKTTDPYSLSGFSAAMDSARAACK